MAVDISKQGAKGGDSGYDTSQLRGVREERGIVTGVVKANVHPTHMGVIKVWIPTFSTDETDKTQWRSVRYCTPFYSRVDNSGVGDTYFGTKVTAGITTPPPDIGTKVLAFFPEGRASEGYYFACVPDLYMMQTLPEATISDGAAAGEFNDSPAGTHHTGKITNWRTQTRPEDFFAQDIQVKQGLSDDRVRGLNNSSYMRESPTEIIGIASKGRRITSLGQDFTVTYNAQLKNPDTADKTVLQGLLGPTARRKGHSIALDDGDIDGNSNQIRLRTSTGHQILLNDTEGVVYVGNSDGSCWIELSNEGTMDVYAQDSINFRSANINFHADENIKMHAKGFAQIVADKQMHLQGKQQLVATSDGEAGITGTKGLHLNSGSELFATAASSAYINSSANMSINGALILLQGPSTKAKIAQPVSDLQKEDTTYFPDLDQFILDEEEMVTTTVDRIVTHEPFPYHGVMNTTSPYTGGLVGGGGGLGGAFSIVGGLGPVAGLAGGAGGLGLSPGALGGALGGAGGITSALGGAGGITSALGGAGGITSALGASGGLAGGLGGLTSAIPGGLTSAIPGGLGGALPGGLTDGVLGQVTGGLDISSVTGSLSGITSNLPVGDLTSQLSGATGALQGADFGKLVTDASGKITGLAGGLGAGLPDLSSVTGGLSKVVPSIPDNLGSVLSAPNINKFPITDMVKQVNTGFSVGALNSFDVQGLNAAVVKQVGSANNPAFIDSATKSVGKFGFNVDQLQSQGFVRPEAVFNDQLADSSVWTGKGGASSLNKLLGNPGLQEQIQQGVVAADYQKLVNIGGITATDGKKEITSMLTASNVSTPEIAAKVRQGTQSIENVLPNTTNIASGEDVASKVKQSMQTGAAASDRVGKIKEEPVTGGEVITGNVYTPTDDLLDSTAEADAQEQANIDAFNAEPLVDNTDNSDPYGLEAQETQAKEREKGELEKSILKKEAELERKKKQGGYAAYKALRDQARQLRTQWWAGRRTLSKAQKAALEAQIKALLAQADAALKGK
jgi:hypothetical protein